MTTSSRPRSLVRQISLVNAFALPSWSSGPTGKFPTWAEAIAAAGYQGVQTFDADTAGVFAAAGLTTSGIGRADTTDEIDGLVGRVEDWGGTAVSVHLGTGFEDDRAAAVLVEHLLERTARASIPVYLETHRATLTQDPGRTVRFAAAYPELRFCSDFSHWYTGVELPYGDLDRKLAALADIFARSWMVHGRISDPGCIQVAVHEDDDRDFVAVFMDVWRAGFEGYLAAADAPDELLFIPELLPAGAHYARTVAGPDGPEEDCDRWTQALLLCDLADALWAEAQAAVAAVDERVSAPTGS